jgi:tetratricopeptide (TPR) repeat protein
MNYPTITQQAFAIALTAVFLAGTAGPADAHSYSAQIKAKKFDEVDKATQAALATAPANVDALLGRVDLLLSMGQESKLDEAVKLAEQCIQAEPSRSECHEYLGNALGTKAINAGILSMMGSLSKIRNAFKKAVELDPKNLDARFALLQYFQQAPAIAGGGKGNARELVDQTTKVNADAGKLMQASLDLGEKEFAKVEAALQQPLPADPYDLQGRQREVMMSLGSTYVREKKNAEALRVFGDMQKRFPESELGAFGAGRALQEQAKYADAIAQFEKALSIKATAPMHYRIGQCLQAANDKPKAIASYERALAFKPELGKKQREDAQEQLKALKG